MRFLVDESTGPEAARWLGEQGHDSVSVYGTATGAEDTEVLRMAAEDNRILVTNDKGFGDLVFRDGRPHRGVVLLRLADERTHVKIAVLSRLLAHHADDLEGNFVVVTEESVRIVKLPVH